MFFVAATLDTNTLNWILILRLLFSLVHNIRGSYFRGLTCTREISKNKNPAKITTYTVFQFHFINIPAIRKSLFFQLNILCFD